MVIGLDLMQALVKTAPGPGNMEIREVPVPAAGPGEVLIEVKAAGVCGSDLHIYHDDIRIPLRPPVIVGHEFAGVVVETGSGVTKWKPGDRVTSETAVAFCGDCAACRAGFYNMCPDRRTLGYWFDGAFAWYTKVPQRCVHALPGEVSFYAGAMAEPAACCVHAVNELTEIRAGEAVAVIGPGPIGLLCLQLARLEGADVTVIGTAKDRERLALAKKLGASAAIDLESDDPASAVWEITGGRGADVVLECSGTARGLALGLELVRRMGRLTQIGLFGRKIESDFERIAYKELKVTGSLGSIRTSWLKALQFMGSGLLQTEPLATTILPLADWAGGFGRFEKKEGLKVIFEPRGCRSSPPAG